MSEFAPCSTLIDLGALDDEEAVAGYVAGLQGYPEPNPHLAGRSHWHGWRNGAVDAGLRERDSARFLLAQAVANAQACTDRYLNLDSFRFPIQ